MEHNSAEAPLKSAAVKSMIVRDWQGNLRVSSCVSAKQRGGNSVDPSDPHESAQASVLSEARDHPLIRTDMYHVLWHVGSGCWDRFINLLDKCKHVKSQAHAAVWLGTAHQDSCTISGGRETWMYYIVIHLPRRLLGLKHSLHPLSIWLWRSAANLNVRVKRVSCGCQETSGQMSQHPRWQPRLSAC